jgi:hypothetical protein
MPASVLLKDYYQAMNVAHLKMVQTFCFKHLFQAFVFKHSLMGLAVLSR